MPSRLFWRGSLWATLGLVASLVGAETGPVFVISNDIGLVEVYPAIAYNSTDDDFLVVWFNDRPGNDDVRARRVSPAGALVGPAFYVSAGPGADRRHPEVAYNATENEHLVVWEHWDPATGAGVHARRVTGAGLVVGMGDTLVRSSSTAYSATMPGVAWSLTSNEYLVVWREVTTAAPVKSTIFAQLVFADGTLDGAPLVVADGPSDYFTHRRYPAVAYNRRLNEFLVVWQDYDETPSSFRISGRRVTGTGTLLAPMPDLVSTSSASNITDPVVTALPNQGAQGELLVAYNDSDTVIYGQFSAGDFSASPVSVPLPSEVPEGFRPAAASQESTRTYWVAEWRLSPPPLAYELISGYPLASKKLLGPEQPLGGDFAQHPAAAAGSAPQSYLTVFDDYPPASSDRGIYGVLWNPNVFADGFESGSTSAWASSTP